MDVVEDGVKNLVVESFSAPLPIGRTPGAYPPWTPLMESISAAACRKLTIGV